MAATGSDNIVQRMEKRFGKVAHGDEGTYGELLYPMESNLLKVHRIYSRADGRRTKEAILLTLHEIEDRITGQTHDTSSLQNRGSLMMKKALMMAFDPFTNPELKEALDGVQHCYDLTTPAGLARFYAIPVRCILRILDSVQKFTTKQEPSQYFEFLEYFMGKKVHGHEMNYAVLAPKGIF